MQQGRARQFSRPTRHRMVAAALLTGALSAPAAADLPLLQLPIDCQPGIDCHIQQYVDRDPGPGSLDHACGDLANDSHKGTDFALPTLAAMRAGVTVRAAAPGRVLGLRDGMPDIDASTPAAPDVTGRECGNGVVLAHGNGWETQYCHLREGSIAVRKGQMVAAGTSLGLVGMSGQATFPHVHLAIRKGNTVIDPFHPDTSAGCRVGGGPDLWQPELPYRPGGLIAIGILDRVPEFAEVEAGLPAVALPDAPAALVVWAYVFAGRSGDRIVLTIDGPNGRVGQTEVTLDRDQPFLFRAFGKRAPDNGFPAGAYRAEVFHRRSDGMLDRRSIDFNN